MNRKQLACILKKMTKTNKGCWLWLGYCNTKGYGRVPPSLRSQGGSLLIHRVIFEYVCGLIPDGLTIDHLCRNRACFNPAHLEPVTNRENILRGIGPTAQNKRKTHCPLGHPYNNQNTVYDKNGHRSCRTCNKDKRKARIARRMKFGPKQTPPKYPPPILYLNTDI